MSEKAGQRATMGRDFLTIIAVTALSAGMAFAANLCWHRMPSFRPDTIGGQVSASSPNQTRGLDPEVESARGTDVPAAAASSKSNGLTADQLLSHLHNGTARFVDAREEREYTEGHLLGAINLPSSAVYARITDVTSMIAPSEKVIVYCGGGDCESSHVVADILRNEFQFTDVQIYEKGWEEIQTSGKFSECTVTGQ